MNLHDHLSRRGFVAAVAAASAAVFTGCTEDTSDDGEGGEGSAAEDLDEDDLESSDLDTEVMLSRPEENRVSIAVESAGRATRLTVERLDERHGSPEDAAELPGEEVGDMDLAAGERRLSIQGRVEGSYAVVASNPQGERDVVESFDIPA